MYCIVIIFLSLERKNNLYLSLVLTFKFFLFNFLCIKILDNTCTCITTEHVNALYFCVHFLDRITCRNLYVIIMYNKNVYLFMMRDV